MFLNICTICTRFPKLWFILLWMHRKAVDLTDDVFLPVSSEVNLNMHNQSDVSQSCWIYWIYCVCLDWLDCPVDALLPVNITDNALQCTVYSHTHTRTQELVPVPRERSETVLLVEGKAEPPLDGHPRILDRKISIWKGNFKYSFYLNRLTE